MAPNGDVLGVTWDPYSGDRVFTFKYVAAEAKWYYNYNPIHTPFWDRPGLHIVPGPFTTPLGTVPYISFIDGLPHDPWYYSTDGLNYVNVSSQSADVGQTTPVSQWLDAKADPSNDWAQPDIDGLFPAFASLGNGQAISDGTFFSGADMKWHDFTLPDGTTPGRIQIDSRGWIHRVQRAGAGFDYGISTDGGRNWNEVHLPDGNPGDFRANAAVGVAAVWAIKGAQDLVYTLDITGDQPKVLRRYVIGKGDDPRTGGVGFYGATGGHRFDFSSIAILPDGRVAVAFMDSTTTEPFPTLTLPVVAPGLAIEMDTTLPAGPQG
jgi:hypothetical protein